VRTVKNKLKVIRLHSEDKVWGNYLLITSGPITHVPYSGDHLYLVTEKQTQLLENEGIRYSEFIEENDEQPVSV